jgi:hypothetical protein
MDLSATWVYQTGLAVTFPVARYSYQGVTVPYFSERNGARLPAYHRMDLAFTLKGKLKPDKKFRSEYNFSIYNVYYRRNAFSIIFDEPEDGPQNVQAIKIYMFAIVPSFTYQFKF